VPSLSIDFVSGLFLAVLLLATVPAVACLVLNLFSSKGVALDC
jgi:hypothetical protein